MKTVLICIVTSCLLVCVQKSSKNDKVNNPLVKEQDDSTRYMNESIALIDSVVGKELIMDSSFFLIDTPISLIRRSCYEYLIADSVTISLKDLDTIILSERKPRVTHWTKEMFPGIRFLHQSLIDSIFKSSLLESWQYFHKNYGFCFHYFSNPIFFRNYTSCLFYADTNCDEVGGFGALILYEKRNGRWKMVKAFCQWTS